MDVDGSTGAWPPKPGVEFAEGRPVEYPQWVSWDLAFELTTTLECAELLSADLNNDGIVNLLDWAIFASQYLKTTF
ncbi:MAG: hypothetical protein GY869_32315 [Planctomycetes bacterium]|nr:hypothetical protein [Planctomycetota bacterium]